MPRRIGKITDLHMIVPSWINFHPDPWSDRHSQGLRADVEEIERLCDDLVAAGLIEPTTLH